MERNQRHVLDPFKCITNYNHALKKKKKNQVQVRKEEREQNQETIEKKEKKILERVGTGPNDPGAWINNV